MDTNKRFSINVKLQQLNRRWHQRKNSSLSARWIGKKATAWKKETPKLISSKLIAYYCHINYKRTVHTHCIRTTLLFSLSFLLFKTNDSDLRTVASSKHKNVSHNALNFFFFFFSSRSTSSSPVRRDFMLQELRRPHIIFIYLNIYNDILCTTIQNLAINFM